MDSPIPMIFIHSVTHPSLADMSPASAIRSLHESPLPNTISRSNDSTKQGQVECGAGDWDHFSALISGTEHGMFVYDLDWSQSRTAVLPDLAMGPVRHQPC